MKSNIQSNLILRRILPATILALLVLVWAAPAFAITFGQPDTDNQFPFVGSIVVHRADGRVGQFCSGTLIAPRVYMTAAHCTIYLQGLIQSGTLGLDNLAISFSNTDIFDEGTWLAVSELYTHPGYNGVSKSSHGVDVGLVILEQPVDGITPAPLPPAGLLDELKAAGMLGQGADKAIFTAVGYGDLLEWPPPQTVNSDGGRWYSYSEYRALNSKWLSLSQNPATGNAGTCYGDSGGPNFLLIDGAWVPVGITSWGDAPCISTNVTYRVDIPETLGFIELVMAGLGE